MSCNLVNPSSIPENIDVQVTLYDPATGERLRDVNSINLNKAMSGTYSSPVVIRMVVNGVSQIRNLKIGIISGNPQDPDGGGVANSDGSVPSGNFGIEHSKIFTSKDALSSFFPGYNITEKSTNINNISLNTLTENSSEYIYLNVKMPDGIVDGYIKYKWFFDFV